MKQPFVRTLQDGLSLASAAAGGRLAALPREDPGARSGEGPGSGPTAPDQARRGQQHPGRRFPPPYPPPAAL